MEIPPRERLILIIDDQPDHRRTIAQVFQESSLAVEIETLSPDAPLLERLHRRENYSHRPRPDLILLDIEGGYELLQAIKADPTLRRIPTIVLSTKGERALDSYQLQCNSYVIKPESLTQLMATIRTIESFWLHIVTLPQE